MKIWGAIERLLMVFDLGKKIKIPEKLNFMEFVGRGTMLCEGHIENNRKLITGSLITLN